MRSFLSLLLFIVYLNEVAVIRHYIKIKTKPNMAVQAWFKVAICSCPSVSWYYNIIIFGRGTSIWSIRRLVGVSVGWSNCQKGQFYFYRVTCYLTYNFILFILFIIIKTTNAPRNYRRAARANLSYILRTDVRTLTSRRMDKIACRGVASHRKCWNGDAIVNFWKRIIF